GRVAGLRAGAGRDPSSGPGARAPKVGIAFFRSTRGIRTVDSPCMEDAVMTRFRHGRTDFFQINTMIPPFNDIRVRKALNCAIDRAAIARLYGGHDAATPTCQIAPPGQSGYKPYCPNTLDPGADGRWRAPDLAYARRLIAASGTEGEFVRLVGAANGGALGTSVVRYTARLLRRLGYQPETQIVPI